MYWMEGKSGSLQRYFPFFPSGSPHSRVFDDELAKFLSLKVSSASSFLSIPPAFYLTFRVHWGNIYSFHSLFILLHFSPSLHFPPILQFSTITPSGSCNSICCLHYPLSSVMLHLNLLHDSPPATCSQRATAHTSLLSKDWSIRIIMRVMCSKIKEKIQNLHHPLFTVQRKSFKLNSIRSKKQRKSENIIVRNVMRQRVTQDDKHRSVGAPSTEDTHTGDVFVGRLPAVTLTSQQMVN